MNIINKDWMVLPRASPIYICGVDSLLDLAFQRASQGQEIFCFSKKCLNRKRYHRATVRDHLIVYGFIKGYTEWVFYREGLSIYSQDLPSHTEGLDTLDDINGMSHDIYRNVDRGKQNIPRVNEGPNAEAQNFYKLMEEGRQGLYPGSKNFSKLSFTI